MAKDIKPGKIKTVHGTALTIATAGVVTADAAKVSEADVLATNGVIHVIDTLLILK